MKNGSVALLVLIFLGIQATGQAGNADLTGQIMDSSGAAILSARVTVTEVDTGIFASTSSGADGVYVFAGLRPGAYKLVVEATGFSQLEQSGINLRTGDRDRVDVHLTPGKITEVVNVTADAPLLQAESGSLRHVVVQQEIQDLPLNGRSFVQLATLSPGVALPPGTLLPRINGGRPRTNEYLFDGVTALLPEPGQVVFFPVIDAIQEFSVESNSVPAQFGRFNGGVVNLSTRAGTNQFHGSVFEFLRNELFNAKDTFVPAGVNKPEFRRNQFGGRMGGPIAKTKTFFFADYQGTRQAIGTTKTSTVPTLAQRQGIFTQKIFDPATTAPNGSGGFTCSEFAGDKIPVFRIDPVALAILNRYPLPNQPG